MATAAAKTAAAVSATIAAARASSGGTSAAAASGDFGGTLPRSSLLCPGRKGQSKDRKRASLLQETGTGAKGRRQKKKRMTSRRGCSLSETRPCNFVLVINFERVEFFFHFLLDQSISLRLPFLFSDIPLRRMGPAFRQYLDGPKVYGCAACKAHVADHDDIVSKVKRKEGFFRRGFRRAMGDDDEDALRADQANLSRAFSPLLRCFSDLPFWSRDEDRS